MAIAALVPIINDSSRLDPNNGHGGGAPLGSRKQNGESMKGTRNYAPRRISFRKSPQHEHCRLKKPK